SLQDVWPSRLDIKTQLLHSSGLVHQRFDAALKITSAMPQIATKRGPTSFLKLTGSLDRVNAAIARAHINDSGSEYRKRRYQPGGRAGGGAKLMLPNQCAV